MSARSAHPALGPGARSRTSPSAALLLSACCSARWCSPRLIVDVVFDGVGAARRRPRSSKFPASDPALAGLQPALLGTLWLMAWSSRSSSRSASPRASTSRSTPTARSGTTASSRSTSRTSPRCPRSSTASSGSRSSCAARSSSAASSWRAALTLGLLVLPVVIIAGARGDPRGAAVDPRGLAGAGRDPVADDLEAGPAGSIPGIATGVILALSRAIGETAPLIVVGAATFVDFNPTGLDERASPPCRSRSSTGSRGPSPSSTSSLRPASSSSSRCCW